MFQLTRRGNSWRPMAFVLAVAAVVCLAAFGDVAADTKDVTVVGPVTVQGAVDATVVAMPPVDVHDLDNPALSAFSATTAVKLDAPFFGLIGQTLATPPPGTDLVIEFLGVQCTVPNGQVVTTAELFVTTGTVHSVFPIPLTPQGTDIFGDNFVGALSVRLYATPSSTSDSVKVGVFRSDETGLLECDFSLEGHLVPLPPSATATASVGEAQPPQELILPYTGILAPEATNPPPGTIVKFEAQ